MVRNHIHAKPAQQPVVQARRESLAQSVRIASRAHAEHDFGAGKEAVEDGPVEELPAEYSQYVDPKYAEQIMQESLMLDDTQTSSRKGPASEVAAEPEAGAEVSSL